MKKQSDWIFNLFNKKKFKVNASSEYEVVNSEYMDEETFHAFKDALSKFGLDAIDLLAGTDMEGDTIAVAIKKGTWTKQEIEDARSASIPGYDDEEMHSGETPKPEEPKKEDTCSGDMPPTMPY